MVIKTLTSLYSQKLVYQISLHFASRIKSRIIQKMMILFIFFCKQKCLSSISYKISSERRHELHFFDKDIWRAGPDSNRWMVILQTTALASSPPAPIIHNMLFAQEQLYQLKAIIASKSPCKKYKLMNIISVTLVTFSLSKKAVGASKALPW